MLMMAAILSHGCSFFGPPSIGVTIATAPDVNPDARNRPSPILVRFYELKSPTAFQAADFFSILDREKDTLGAELVMRDEFSLAPMGKQEFKRTLQADTKFIGVVAAYRDIDRAVWRSSFAVPAKRSVAINVRLDARRMTILADGAPVGAPAPLVAPANAPTKPAAPAR
jgi:type VI secretion system protein VasD